MIPICSSVSVADILADSLAAVFDALSTERYGRPVSLRRVALAGSSPDTVHVRLGRPDLCSLEATLTIRHVGGNVYDVEGRVEGRPPQSFAYCLPAPAPRLVPEAPRLARDVAAVLLDALERRVGRDFLRQTVCPGADSLRPVAPSPPAAARDGRLTA
ncbi:MAG: hypothetical protein V5A48_08015 [Salinivenus sp.]